MDLARVSIMGFVSRTCITKPGLTFPWKRTRQSRGKFKGRSWAEWWRYPESADCTIGTSGTLPDAIFLSQRRSARRISAPGVRDDSVPHDRHSRLAEFSSARFRLQYPPRQPTERNFRFSIPTVSSANFGYFDHIGSIHQPALAHWLQS